MNAQETIAERRAVIEARAAQADADRAELARIDDEMNGPGRTWGRRITLSDGTICVSRADELRVMRRPCGTWVATVPSGRQLMHGPDATDARTAMVGLSLALRRMLASVDHGMEAVR